MLSEQKENCTLSDDPGSYHRLDLLYWSVFQVMFPILIIVGIITNILNLIVLTRPKMMTSPYRWLRALAMADLLLSILTIPVCLANSGHGPSSYFIAFYYSYFGWSLSIAAQIVSYYFMVWFAYDRYLAVCHPHKYPASLKDKIYRLRVLVTVALVFILYIPTILVGEPCQLESEYDWKSQDGYSRGMHSFRYRIYAWTREVISRVLPGIFITYFYIKVALRLKELRSVRKVYVSRDAFQPRREMEQRMVHLLFCVTVCFYVYNTPVTLYYLLFLDEAIVTEGSALQSIETFGVLSNLIQMVGNVSNFILYFLINSEFQKALLSLFQICNKSIGNENSDLGDDGQSKKTTPIVQNRDSYIVGHCNQGQVVNDQSDSGCPREPTTIALEDLNCANEASATTTL